MMSPDPSARSAVSAPLDAARESCVTAMRSVGLAFVLLAAQFASVAFAADAPAADELLLRADEVKTANHAEFSALLDSLAARAPDLTARQHDYLAYLTGWGSAYRGEYEEALRTLRTLSEESSDVTLQFRARATMANVLAVATQYEEAFAQLERLIALLPQVTDGNARDQGLAVAAYLYNQVGEHTLALNYAQMLEQENWRGRGACKGAQLKLEALYKSVKLTGVGAEFQEGLDACAKSGEVLYAHAIRTYAARLHIDQGKFDEAIALLTTHYADLLATGYGRLISEFDALLAIAYRANGDAALVREHAQRAVKGAVKNQYTEPLVTAYRLLYVVAKEAGDVREALAYHEKYSVADKGYLDDVTARQLAYQRVSHATLADKLRIDTLNKENEVLQLQRALDKKRVETSSLYIALLILVIVTTAFWAYRTKRSQLHFMRLSQVDGLTGIANRPRFIELAESALENARKSGQEVCVVLCDLDHFKSINDKHGHAAGDFVLKQTVAACQTHLRTSDIFGRFGGEEFGVVLPGCSLEDARQRAEQLRLAIAAVSGNYEGVEVSVSGSFGVASSAASGFELRQLLAHADAALYRAKHAGRNYVAVADVRGAELSASGGARYGFSEGAADAMARVKTSW
jgi:diguanylate cyclase (GGDEF)-like protein